MRIAIHLNHPRVHAWNWGPSHTQRLQEAIPGWQIDHIVDRDAFLKGLATADAAAVWTFHQEWFALAPRLRLLATPAAGRDYFHVEPPPGVRLAYGTFHGWIMAETVVGALLAMCRGILPAATSPAGEPWPQAALSAGMRLLRGSRVTILGYGHIGRHVAALLQPFGALVTGIRRSTGKPGEQTLDIPDVQVRTVVELPDILPRTDHLVVVLPATPQTYHLVDRDLLRLLPPHATLVNVGRGSTIDEKALLDHLHEHPCAGAFLDVFEEEPLPENSPLRACPNLWTLPHLSAVSDEYMFLFAEELAKHCRSLRNSISR